MSSRIAVEPYIAVWAERAAKAGLTAADVVDAALADVTAELFWTHPDIQAAVAAEVRDV
jgi:hypothetical protein